MHCALHWVLCKLGRRNNNEHWCISKLWFGQKYFNHLLYFICTFIFQSSAVPGRRNTNSQLAQSPVVMCKRCDRSLIGRPLTFIFGFSKCFNSARLLLPTHILAHLQAHKTLTQNLTCKSAKILQTLLRKYI